MAAKLLALCAVHTLPQGRFLVLISVGGGVNPGAIMRLEEFGQFKNAIFLSVFEPASFRFLALQPPTQPRVLESILNKF
jgi:hypothetical protein